MRFAIVLFVFVITMPRSSYAIENKIFKHPPTANPQDHNNQRAGNPQVVSRHATPSVEKHEGLGYVGGGKLIKGDARGPADGTFGMDYQGFGWHPGRVFLGWSHDRKHQPKLGTYTTDTYKVPDPVAHHPLRKLLQPRDH
ncbi:MAG: hypothetical protein K8T89_07265 [Planctomycetes bacterium]|nr:hypothetical protein [Planctomycetota bacterium]